MKPAQIAHSVKHYENFPVASLLLPKRCVPAVQALYRFARAADDIADEGEAPTAQRLSQLAALQHALTAPAQCDTALVKDLNPFIAQGVFPLLELQKLLSAFTQDVQQDHAQTDPRHADLDSLLDYCSRSANPIGRMMLRLTGSTYTPETQTYSDDICTALQLINFWQDVAKDALRGRCYIPFTHLTFHGFPNHSTDPRYVSMMQALCDDARTRMVAGAPLLQHLRGRFRAEIALTMAGGLRILDKLQGARFAISNPPIRLSYWDALPIARQAGALMLKHR